MLINKSLSHASLYDLYKVSGFDKLKDQAASASTD